MQILCQLMLIEYGRVRQPERPCFHPYLYIVRFACLEDGTAGAQIECPCRTVVFGGLQQLAFLPVVQADFLEVIHRELAQIHRPVLRITYLYPIIEDT